MQSKKLLKPVFGLLAGEISGDNLGAALIRSLKELYPDASFVGVGGANMIAEGMISECDIEQLSVNGFIDPLKRLPTLFRILFKTRDKILASNVKCFIGVDFNFFNLLLAGMLKKHGVKTVHYVSPTVWAWRKGRIKSIAKKIDLMLTLYPFELNIYEKNNIKAVFVGHPKADEISLSDGPDKQNSAREYYQIKANEKVVAIMPGSRGSEVAYSAPDFLGAAEIMLAKYSNLRFLIPAVNEKREAQLLAFLQDRHLPVEVSVGNARDMMLAADVILVNSGTATLEAMLLKKPMVMSYRLGKFTYAIVSRLVDSKFFALPNILSQKSLVPEFIQDDATPMALAAAVLSLLESDDHRQLLREFDAIHRELRKNAANVAAAAISELVEGD
ncbi:MAG: lipid-A-disaccharide synthase [Candidatus Azotimanducaceae bacterium]